MAPNSPPGRPKRKTSDRNYRNLDWAKYSDFRSRHSRDDLAKLCSGYKRNELQQIFNTADKTGLYPIHWAAINNRSDLIDFLLDNGAHLRVKCRNKLFADGTSLHLAVMNGCIEAAGMLLSRHERAKQETTKPKSLYNNDENPPPTMEDGPKINRASEPAPEASKDNNGSHWLTERDSEGQTPLMRSAAPKSKRLDIVRDLLRKNLWSLSARPAEMALFLINKGADWRETDSKFHMNLMHLAIINDYDDIVNMLIVIDHQLLNIPARIKQSTDKNSDLKKQSQKESSEKEESPTKEFVTIKLDTPSPSPSSNSSSSTINTQESDSSKPLISRKETITDLLTSGLTPLQLAIIYGRLNIISLIWNANLQQQQQQQKSPNSRDKHNGFFPIVDGKTHKSPIGKETVVNSAELRAILLRVVWSNKDELFSLVRGSFLKILLALDLALLTLVWMPTYLMVAKDGSGRAMNLRSFVFITSYCMTLLLVLRVISKNPGYLAKNRGKYFRELARIVGKKHERYVNSQNSFGGGGVKKNGSSAQVTNEQQRNLLQLEEISMDTKQQSEVEFNARDNKSPPKEKQPAKVRQDKRQTTGKEVGDLDERVRLLCHRCRTIRKRRSRHCDHCNACVQDFDHHCIYLGCCIGRQNRLDFLIMLIATSLTAIYGTIIEANQLDREQWQSFWHFLGLVSISKYALIGSLSVFFILRRASLGVTMYEDIRSNRIRRIFGPNGVPMNIMRSHKMYSTLKDSFWRYAPNRYLTGDLPYRKILDNLKEFTNNTNLKNYLTSVVNICPDFSSATSMFNRDQKVNDMYRYV